MHVDCQVSHRVHGLLLVEEYRWLAISLEEVAILALCLHAIVGSQGDVHHQQTPIGSLLDLIQELTILLRNSKIMGNRFVALHLYSID